MAGLASLVIFMFLMLTASVRAEIQTNIEHTDLNIPVGGSVTVYANPFFTSYDVSYLDALYSGLYIQLFDVDYAIQGTAFYSAPGSTEGLGIESVFVSDFASGYFPLTFHYEKAGLYHIAYSFSFGGVLGPLGNVFTSPDLADPATQYVAGPFLERQFFSSSGEGTLDVRVGSVPEPTTWAMLLLGFVAMGAFASGRNARAIKV